MIPLRFQKLSYRDSDLLAWKDRDYRLLERSKASAHLKQLLVEKAKHRGRRTRRFFGEAFVAAHVNHDEGRYTSIKWLTSPASGSRVFGHAAEYRSALSEVFPSLGTLPKKAYALRTALGGKTPVPPDLWLIVGGEHRFIEVKLPGDSVRDTQIAGLAVIATCLSKKRNVSVWIYDLRPEGEEPGKIDEELQAKYRRFCQLCV